MVKNFALATLVVFILGIAPNPPVPIPNQDGGQPVPVFIGTPAVARPIAAPEIPSNPFMLQGSWNNIHDDSYMSDTYPGPGPLGQSPTSSSTFLGTAANPIALVVGITFDRQEGNMVAAAIKPDRANATATVWLTLIDSDRLTTLAEFALPTETGVFPGSRISGAYFYADEHDRTIIGTVERSIWVVSHRKVNTGQKVDTEQWEFSHDSTYDLRPAIPEGDSIQALQPDFSGRIWVTSKGGVVCTVDAKSGNILGTSQDLQLLGERIVNGHAVDEKGGVFIASTRAMYRFDPDAFGRPVMTWREPYEEGTHVKPGQVDLGTGTTPTLMGSKYVTITDNAEPHMRVLVFQRAPVISGARLVCAVPVFQAYAGCTENSLIATDKSIIVENNFGYRSSKVDVTQGRTTTPGISRIDVDSQGTCSTIWTNDSVSIPSVVSKLSLKNGLIYTYTKPAGPGTTDPWYFTAIDFQTGKALWKRLAGTGTLYDNNYAGAYLDPNGRLYVGVNGGIVMMRDGK